MHLQERQCVLNGKNLMFPKLGTTNLCKLGLTTTTSEISFKVMIALMWVPWFELGGSPPAAGRCRGG